MVCEEGTRKPKLLFRILCFCSFAGRTVNQWRDDCATECPQRVDKSGFFSYRSTVLSNGAQHRACTAVRWGFSSTAGCWHAGTLGKNPSCLFSPCRIRQGRSSSRRREAGIDCCSQAGHLRPEFIVSQLRQRIWQRARRYVGACLLPFSSPLRPYVTALVWTGSNDKTWLQVSSSLGTVRGFTSPVFGPLPSPIPLSSPCVYINTAFTSAIAQWQLFTAVSPTAESCRLSVRTYIVLKIYWEKFFKKNQTCCRKQIQHVSCGLHLAQMLK